jgi:hypothetical protein
MIDRRERPSSIVRPEPKFSKMESARAANRRRQRVAPLTDRASMDKDERERGSVCHSPSHFSLPRKGCRVGLRIVLFEMLWGGRWGDVTIVS